MTVILLRHGRSTANTAHVLAGRTAGVELDEVGRGQADAVAERVAHVPRVAAIVRSPLLRCGQTVGPLASARGIEPVIDDRLAEVDYGSWTGRPIGELAKESLWTTVQRCPSAAVFPDGEGLADVQRRAVQAIREYDRIYGGPDGNDVWIACSHGDVIKAVIADAMCMHLDSFQRIVVEPASMSVVRYGSAQPFVHTVNSTGGQPAVPQRPPPTAAPGAEPGATAADDAVVGGSTGVPAQPVAP